MSNGNFNSLQFFPLNFDHRLSMDKHAILAVKKTNLVFFCEKYIKPLCLGSLCAKRRHLDCFSITSTQHFPFCRHFRFCLSSAYTDSASVYLAKMISDESSDSEMPYDSSDEEVWEEEEVSGDDDSDGGPGFLDPTRRHSLPGI